MYQSDGTIERMIAKEVVMHHQWNGASHRTREVPSAVYVYPKRQLLGRQLRHPQGWLPHPEAAKTFVNWMMAPENIAIASNFTGYMNAIKGSEDFLDQSLREDPAVNMPAEYADRLRPAQDCGEKARELREVWTRLKT